MAGALERFRAEAARRGVEVDVREFPRGTRTASDAARAVGCDVGQIVKSLVCTAGEEPFLALTAGSNRADLRRLAGIVGAAEVRMANAEEARGATGYAIGGTPPFGHPRPLRTLVDRDLLAHEVVWAAAGTPSTVFPIRPTDLLEVTNGEVVDLKEG